MRKIFLIHNKSLRARLQQSLRRFGRPQVQYYFFDECRGFQTVQ